MLDVHPPEHAIHGTRDFLVHLLTITIGLLIALALEAGVEALHHRSERREAEATLREELTQNRQALLAIQKQTDRERDGLRKMLVFYEDLRDGKKDDASVLGMDFNTEPLGSAGWQTATVTGAVSFMPYEEVQRFSAAYQLQQLFEDAVAKAFDHFALLATFGGREQTSLNLSRSDTENAIVAVRQLMADIDTMSDLTRGMLVLYADALKQ